MKNFSLLLMCCMLLIQSLFAFDSYGRVDWLRNYDEAVQRSQRESKPLVILFTGSDWCSWCTKLEKEALDTPEFAQQAGTKFIFLALDFPMYKAQDPQLTQQNKELQKKYDVKGFPTLVILDSKQRKIGTAGYRSGGGRAYAEYLNKMVDNFQGYQQKAAALDGSSLKGQDLKRLYEKALEFQLKSDQQKIVMQGLNSDFSHYFLTEQYRLLVSENGTQELQAVALRQQLLEQDPTNRFWTHYKIAIIDFEANHEQLEKGHIGVEEAVEPLIAYIDQFQKQDSENVWRLELLVAQVLYGHKHYHDALKFAQSAYTNAPASVREEISTGIESIKVSLANQL